MSAGILDMAGFRSCSYALDWGRSGSLLLRDLLSLETDEVYWLHFHKPSTMYEQVCEVTTEVKTVEIKPQKPVYGYPYFYNPHRPLGLSKDYHLRCINRLKSTVNSFLISKIFFFVQRLDNPAETYFPDIDLASNYLWSTLSEFVNGDWSAIICSFHASRSCLPYVKRNQLKENIYHVQVAYPNLLGADAYHPYVVSACFPTKFRRCHKLYVPGRSARPCNESATVNCFRPWAY